MTSADPPRPDGSAGAVPRNGRTETADERHDRNWTELLNELRVAQTGVQLIAGFLLTIPFTDRFEELSRPYRTAYLVAFGLAVCATLLIIAPTTIHRALYGRHRKGELVAVSDRLAKAGLAFLGATLVSVAFLIFGLTGGTGLGVTAAVAVAVLALTLWCALPLRLRGRTSAAPTAGNVAGQ